MRRRFPEVAGFGETGRQDAAREDGRKHRKAEEIVSGFFVQRPNGLLEHFDRLPALAPAEPGARHVYPGGDLEGPIVQLLRDRESASPRGQRLRVAGPGSTRQLAVKETIRPSRERSPIPAASASAAPRCSSILLHLPQWCKRVPQLDSQVDLERGMLFAGQVTRR